MEVVRRVRHREGVGGKALKLYGMKCRSKVKEGE